jgi:hypothetical protein
MPEEWIPRPYMVRGFDDLVADPRHGLFEDPGLSKTATTLAAFIELQNQLDVQRLLVIAPLRVCYSTWPGEIAKWKQFNHLKIVNLHEQGLGEDADVFVCNPEFMPKLFGHPNPEKRRYWIPGLWKDWVNRPEMLAVDEVRGWRRVSGVRYRTLKRYINDFGRRTVLTGSPAPNGHEGLHGPITILEGGRSLEDGACIDPRIGEFREKYFRPMSAGRRQWWKIRRGCGDKILEAIAPRVTCLRREDWLDVPERITTTISVEMPDSARKHYDTMHDHACVKFSEDDFILTDGDAAAGKCRQICNGFVYDEDKVARPLHDVKVKALKDLLDDIGAHPTIIFYEFNHDRAVLQKALGNVPHMGKGTSLKAGVQIEEDWNVGKIQRLLYNPFSAAHGLNFQGGGYHLIWYNPPWDLEVYDQAIYRVDRIGQVSDRILIYILAVRDSIEESVSKVLARKQKTEADIKAALVKEFSR